MQLQLHGESLQVADRSECGTKQIRARRTFQLLSDSAFKFLDKKNKKQSWQLCTIAAQRGGCFVSM